jgi:hypothetical protein
VKARRRKKELSHGKEKRNKARQRKKKGTAKVKTKRSEGTAKGKARQMAQNKGTAKYRVNFCGAVLGAEAVLAHP